MDNIARTSYEFLAAFCLDFELAIDNVLDLMEIIGKIHGDALFYSEQPARYRTLGVAFRTVSDFSNSESIYRFPLSYLEKYSVPKIFVDAISAGLVFVALRKYCAELPIVYLGSCIF